jgi:hypothetical protein
VFLAQDARHVVVGVAGMDDQRQPGPARRLDMDAQAFLLHGGAVGGVVVVQPVSPMPTHFGCAASATSSSTVAIGSFGHAHRMRADGVEDARHAPRRWRARGLVRSRVQIVTIRVTPAARRGRSRRQARRRNREIQMRVAVDDLGALIGGHRGLIGPGIWPRVPCAGTYR